MVVAGSVLAYKASCSWLWQSWDIFLGLTRNRQESRAWPSEGLGPEVPSELWSCSSAVGRRLIFHKGFSAPACQWKQIGVKMYKKSNMSDRGARTLLLGLEFIRCSQWYPVQSEQLCFPGRRPCSTSLWIHMLVIPLQPGIHGLLWFLPYITQFLSGLAIFHSVSCQKGPTRISQMCWNSEMQMWFWPSPAITVFFQDASYSPTVARNSIPVLWALSSIISFCCSEEVVVIATKSAAEIYLWPKQHSRSVKLLKPRGDFIGFKKWNPGSCLSPVSEWGTRPENVPARCVRVDRKSVV